MYNKRLPENSIDFRLLERGDPRRSNYKRKLKSFRLSEEALAGLELVAQMHSTYWGGKVSIAALLEKIGLFELNVSDPNTDAKQVIIDRLRAEHGE